MRRRFALIACARWENAYITEWLLYHRSIGFEHVYLYCNDDDPTELFAQVAPFLDGDAPFVTFVHYPFQGQQYHMYLNALRRFRHEADWIMFLDIDEFLVLRGLNDVGRYVDSIPTDWDSINFNWVFFGNNGFRTRPPGSVLLQYTRREDKLHPFTKNLTRTDSIDMGALDGGYRATFWHFWITQLAPHMRCVNVLGDDIRPYYAAFPDSAVDYLASGDRNERIMEIGLVHHYHLKSEADFLMRYERGVKGDFYRQDAWRSLLQNGGAPDHLQRTNAVEDLTLADYWQTWLDRARRTCMVRPPAGRNLALGRPARQSSVSLWSQFKTIEEDAALATDGNITGTHCFHTDHEMAPWWRVDLGEQTQIAEIRIFNRVENPAIEARINPFVLEISDNDEDWEPIYEKTDTLRVGGVDGAPFIHRPENVPTARFVRIRLLQETCLHLDQVEVYAK